MSSERQSICGVKNVINSTTSWYFVCVDSEILFVESRILRRFWNPVYKLGSTIVKKGHPMLPQLAQDVYFDWTDHGQEKFVNMNYHRFNAVWRVEISQNIWCTGGHFLLCL